MTAHWTSYDCAATSHESLAVPSIFAPPATDLVSLLDVGNASAVLDVGAGTGVAARIAAANAPAGAFVVALDPAARMLRVARGHGLAAVTGTVPGLPFAHATFDRVMASFVLSHVHSCDEAVRDMVRVLRPNGKLGVTAWGPLENEFRLRWQTHAEAAVGKEALDRAVFEALPGEDRFADAAALAAVLNDAGLSEIQLHYRRYEVRTTIADFLSIREDSIYGRFVRRSLDARGWHDFKARMNSDFRKRFADPVVYTRDVHIAIAHRLP